ncbi:unnamed protein product [Owenia fusiformis]|uniref:Uncharacterized protein n=1 Tax=Owenia fusiformis TaxID=6347 RepID=A0A8J1UNW4_OWEFU|nr:unnamed protein product [Owenia fusiformis]
MGANTSLPDKGASYSNSRSSTLSRYANAILGEPDPPVPKERKKKSSKLATLRKKLIRVRRHSRNFDYAKTIREFTSNWSIRELHALVEEYESSALLKELTIQANLARPRANTYKEDLSDLYDYKYCTDVDLIYQGACFPVHRAILSARCSHFKDLLAQYPGYGAEIPIHIRTPGIDVGMFSDLLRYLYTGEIQSGVTKLDSLDLLVQLSEEFGTLNYLETDLRTLLETSDHSDAVLVFSNDADYLTPETANESPNSKHELRCHKSILAARSPFFRNLLMRRARSGEEINERALQAPTRIVLDESVIPKQYARVLLHAIYLDSVDLTCVVRGSSSTCSLSEVQAMVSGKGHMTHTDEAMEIYQIGQFIDFPILSQGIYFSLM